MIKTFVLKSCIFDARKYCRYFIFCWPRISSQILANNQIDALFRVFIYLFIHFIFLHVSSIKRLSSGDRTVLIYHLVW